MTKKFWADWQKRVGETENIYLYDFCEGRKTNVKNHLYLAVEGIFGLTVECGCV